MINDKIKNILLIRTYKKMLVMTVFLLATIFNIVGCATDIDDRVDWVGFMSRHDMIWKKIPDKWETGAFMGNGLIGANVFATEDGKNLMWHIGRSDVAFKTNRLPIGNLILETTGSLAGCNLKLDLWNAELKGSINTTNGKIEVRSFTHSEQLVQVIEIIPEDGEKNCKFKWQPGLAVNPRLIYRKEPIPENEKNPEPVSSVKDGINISFQLLTTGGGHAAAWKEISTISGSRIFFVSVGYSISSETDAIKEAVDNVNKAESEGINKLTASHRKWWNNFYPASFVSIPDTRLESFYWIQLYKMASGTRADRPMLDLMGPWFRITPWPRIWWNLNVQLTYWAQLASNHLELGESLLNIIDNNKEALAQNANQFSSDSYAIGRSSGYDLVRPVSHELCGLPWAMHNYYLQYRYSMDDKMLSERLFPMLKGSINYYLHLLKEGDDGYLHITDGYSSEYPNQPTPNPDCNIDLALLRWGCQTLLEISDRLKINDPLIPKWKETLQKLVPYPTDENGLKISASVSFTESHRHYSHLLMIYPLYIMNLDQPENRELVTKSLNHWMGLPDALEGYSFTGASSISSLMGRGDDAAMYLNKLLDTKIHPNTMYTESGPVIETPLSGAASLHDMLLTSWGNKIRIFPAVPSSWKDITFHNMRTEGAFLVSAVRKNGELRFIRIESLAGEPCRLVTDMKDPKGEGVSLRKVAENEYELNIIKGQTVILTPGGIKTDLTIAPVASQKEKQNYYGYNK